jgi:hypothetical protein
MFSLRKMLTGSRHSEQKNARRNRNAYCSFCRKSYRDVGPLVEGPGDVYICGECIELCQSIIEKEKLRRNPPPPVDTAPENLQELLDSLIPGQEDAKAALSLAPSHQRDCKARVLLFGPNRSSSILLSRTLAHVLRVPFVFRNLAELEFTGIESIPGLSQALLLAAGYDKELAQRAVVYFDGLQLDENQEILVRLWEAIATKDDESQINLDRALFVCGCLAEPKEDVSRSLTREKSHASVETSAIPGFRPGFLSHFLAVARVKPLDEETLFRLETSVDLDQLKHD